MSIRNTFDAPAAIKPITGFFPRLEAGNLSLHLLHGPDQLPFRLPSDFVLDDSRILAELSCVHTPLHGKVVDSAVDLDAIVSKAGEVTMS